MNNFKRNKKIEKIAVIAIFIFPYGSIAWPSIFPYGSIA